MPDRHPICGFCDGTGQWADSDGDLATVDPCPLCDGTGVPPGVAASAGDESQPSEALTLSRLLALLPRLTQPERQRLYEELHALYDCRIYRR